MTDTALRAAPSELTAVALDAGGRLEMLIASEPDARFALHWHPEWSVGAIREGDCRFVCMGQACHAVAGDLVLMPPWAMHTAGASVARFGMVMMYVPHDWLAARLGWPAGQRPSLRRIAWHDAALAQCLLQAADDDRQRLPALIARVVGPECTAPMVGVGQHSGDARIDRVCALLQSVDGCDLDPAALAQTLGVTREHFHRLFRQAVGMAPAQYARLARIARAKALLGQACSVAETAAQCGFADQAHFSRWFRRCFGVTPARYAREAGSA
jgi:AraC-like DNA-binding protein/quercetin dioxygenase-like cupin family protein